MAGRDRKDVFTVTPRTVIIASIAGCIVNSIAIALATGSPILSLILSPGREFWAVVFAFALIPIFARMSGAVAWIAGFVVLNALASLSAKLIFEAGAPWIMVLLFNGIYAIVAIAVFVGGRSPAGR